MNAATRGLQKLVRTFAGTSVGAWLFGRVLWRLDRPVYQLTRGRHTLANLLSGLPVALLTTTGAKSGLPRTAPVVAFPTPEGLAVIASNFGQRRHPGWYYNLRSHPEAQLAVGGKTTDVTAVETEGAQRERIWKSGLALYPAWTGYERRAAGRRIAVFVLKDTQAD